MRLLELLCLSDDLNMFLFLYNDIVIHLSLHSSVSWFYAATYDETYDSNTTQDRDNNDGDQNPSNKFKSVFNCFI